MNNELELRRDLLRRAIDRDRANLRRAAHHLKVVVAERTDVGAHVARQPYQWIAGGFFLGVVLGLNAGSRH